MVALPEPDEVATSQKVVTRPFILCCKDTERIIKLRRVLVLLRLQHCQ